MMTDFDVAVIGYGPTGMTLAALLGQRGHRVVVLERYEGLYNLPRAACFDDEIMRTFQKLGLTDAISEGAVAQRDYDWLNADGETLVEIEYPDPGPGGWAALYMMFQPHVETVLDRHIRAQPGIEVRQGFTVSGISQDTGGVTVRGADGTPSVRARYMIGADGGGGFTRRTLCDSVDDYGFQENWLVCDFRMRRAVPGLPMFRQICNPAQPTSIVRIGPEHHRFSFMLNPGETPEQAVEPARVWARVSPYLSQDDAEMIRVVNYVFRSRIAGQWRQGRVLLAGDAAHEMPPFLGQGMCSGIRGQPQPGLEAGPRADGPGRPGGAGHLPDRTGAACQVHHREGHRAGPRADPARPGGRARTGCPPDRATPRAAAAGEADVPSPDRAPGGRQRRLLPARAGARRR